MNVMHSSHLVHLEHSMECLHLVLSDLTAVKMAIVSSDDMNWNALEWDRAAEELTWERVSKNHFPEFNNPGSYLKLFVVLLCYDTFGITSL